MAIVLYVAAFTLALITIQLFWQPGLLNPAGLLNWDAGHYHHIKELGYQDFRVAFFPLFPYLWKFLSVDQFGIVVFNAALFLISFNILLDHLKVSTVHETLLYLSIPSFIFFYLPYSEAVFFLCSVLILLGLKHEKIALVYLGLFFSVLSRPAFSVFIPGLLITEFFRADRNKFFLRAGIYFIITFLALSLVAVIQFVDTGEWFKFFNAQQEWGNRLQMPSLPLTSWAGGFVVRLDGFAFLIGILAGGYLLARLVKLKWAHKADLPVEVVFSLAYLGGITLAVLFFRGGSLFSLNRFVLATPFIIVAVNCWLKQEFRINNKQLFLIFGLIFLFWMLFGAYSHIREILKYALLSLYALLPFVLMAENKLFSKSGWVLIILLNFTFQLILMFRFLTGLWVG